MRLFSAFSAAALSLMPLPALVQIAQAQTQDNRSADMSPQARFVVNEMTRLGHSSLVVMDKAAGEMLLIDQGRVFKKFPALYGAGPGEDIYADQRVTPAGIWAMKEYLMPPAVAAEYAGGRGYAFLCTSRLCAMVHPLWKKDPSERREQRLASSTPLDNAITRGGCINLSDKNYLEDFDPFVKSRIAYHQTSPNVRMATLPRLVVLPLKTDIAYTARILGLSQPTAPVPAP